MINPKCLIKKCNKMTKKIKKGTWERELESRMQTTQDSFFGSECLWPNIKIVQIIIIFMSPVRGEGGVGVYKQLYPSQRAPVIPASI